MGPTRTRSFVEELDPCHMFLLIEKIEKVLEHIEKYAELATLIWRHVLST